MQEAIKNLDDEIKAMTDKVEFISEWTTYDNDEEKQKALSYLNLWQYFFFKKCDSYYLIEKIIIDRPSWGDQKATLALKICIKRKDEYASTR